VTEFLVYRDDPMLQEAEESVQTGGFGLSCCDAG
jgi:hypothetical protein